MFLAWGTARLIKTKFIKSDLNKPTAIILAFVWGLIWVIGAAIVFEYIVGSGTFNKRLLFPSIFSSAVISYYAFTAKISKTKSRMNVQSTISTETLENPTQQTKKINSLKNNIFQKLFLAKAGPRALISLIAALVLFTLILASQAYTIRAEWLKYDASPLAKTQICYKLFNNLDLTNEELSLVPKVNDLSFLLDSTGKVVICEKEEFCELLKSSVLSEIGCLNAENRGSLLTFLKSRIHLNDLEAMISFSIFVGVVIFFILLTVCELIVEKSLGWKRLSIVLGGLFSIIGTLFILTTENSFQKFNFVVLIIITPIFLYITTVLLMLKGKLLFEWIKQGFTEK